jgi:hypothetical protein
MRTDGDGFGQSCCCWPQAGIEDASGFIIFPLVIHTMDLVVSAIGIMSIGSKSAQKPNQAVEDPYDVIKVRSTPPRPLLAASFCCHGLLKRNMCKS